MPRVEQLHHLLLLLSHARSSLVDGQGKLISSIGDEDTCVEFLLGGVGEDLKFVFIVATYISRVHLEPSMGRYIETAGFQNKACQYMGTQPCAFVFKPLPIEAQFRLENEFSDSKFRC